MVLKTSYASRNIGDVFYTLRSDATLNGAVPTDGTEYNASDFDLSNEDNNPYTLCINNKLPNLPYADYNQQVSSQGCCAYFGVDTANGRFKVPTIKDVFIEAGDSASLAKYLAPGLPNITGWFSGHNVAGGSFWVSGGSEWHGNRNNNGQKRTISFDASRSSAIYGRSSTVQPKALLLRPMIQLITVAGTVEEEEDEPSPSLKIPYIFVPGTEAKATEVNANFDYVLRALESADTAPVVHIDKDETIIGRKTFTAAITTPNLELMPSSTAMHGGYIDFHYAGTTADYTARLIENSLGHLAINQNPDPADSSTNIATTNWVKTVAMPVFSSDGTTWSITYPNGWVRQGGQISMSGSTIEANITFSVTMKDTNYAIFLSGEDISSSTVRGVELGWGQLTTTGMRVARESGYSGTQRMRWSIEGWKA